MHRTEAKSLADSAWKQVYAAIQPPADPTDEWTKRYMANGCDMESYYFGSRDRFALILQTLAKHISKGSKILDAGAGYGVQAAVFKEAGYQAYASDIYDSFPVYAALNIPYRQWHIEGEEPPYPANSFDAVILSQTIEHFTYSPRKPIQKLLSLLKPGGMLLIDAPNISSFHNISRLVRGKTVMWNMKEHYLEQEPIWHAGIPYYDRHNHELCMQDLMEIADFFNLEVMTANYYSPYNAKKSFLSRSIARLRDIIPHWRKGLFALMRKPLSD